MSSITSANSIFMLTITGLYAVPQQLQGFAAEDIFDTEDIDTSEEIMGADGKLSAGFIFVPIKQSVMLQADSVSNALFESWYAAEQAAREKYFAQGIVQMPSIKRTYQMKNGVLKSYKPIADAKKVLQPRKFGIVWESVTGAPV